MYTVHLPLFEGPLDLLLHLIEKKVGVGARAAGGAMGSD